MKKAIAIITIIILLIGGFFLYKHFNKTDQVQYEAVQPERKNLIVSVTSSGTVAAFRSVEVKSKASGNILRLHVKEGDIVKKGQLLLELDKTDELSKIRQAQANLMASVARVTQAQEKLKEAARAYDQQVVLANEKLITAEQLLQSETAKKLAIADQQIQEASLINAQEQLKSEELRFADTEVRAPIDGIVLEKSVEEGQIISSGISANNGGTLILILGDISRILAKAEVDEVDISKIHRGQKVNIAADAYERKKFEGELTHISPQAINKSNVTVFDIEIEITDKDKNLLKPGMTVTAEIITASKDNVLTLPITAITRKRRSAMVTLKKNNDYIQVPVEKGIENDTDAEIISGITENDTAYIKPKEPGNKTNGRGGQGRNSSMGMMRGLH